MRLIGALCVLIGLTVQANGQFRKYSNEFLNIGAGARSLGMGGANVASSSGANASYWNPALLSTVKDNPDVSLMHAEYFTGIGKYDYGSIAFPINNNKRTIGFSLMRFGIDDIPNTLYLVDADGSVNYNNLETFSSADYAFMLSMSQIVKTGDDYELSMGGNVKVIRRNIGSFAKAWGFGIDAAVHYKKKNWQLGAVLRDATSTFNTWSFTFTDREKEVLYLTNNDIPTQSTEMTAPRLWLGGGYTFKFNEKLSLLTELMLDLSFDGKRNTIIKSDFANVDPRAGAELNFNDALYVRAGIGNFQQGLKDGDTTNMKKVWIYQPSFGAGFRIKNVKIDYAFTNLSNQSSPLYTHVISLGFNIIKKEK
ncbi:putative type IX sorting system protein PorV2 [Polluticaenibacter yanchengensis]|uniref:PorV/PorQ family protein n=1 Tax=Polluticaenibacter yanchengensis TaxID=3014562 RepID=A0ABT4UGC7_9BACT|nr:PorV/PorQ family protein [Chitinophagaceae bacterium LY-5]